MDKAALKLFQEMYPNASPKYYTYFNFGENVDGDKLKSIDVWFTHGLKYEDYIQIVKGKNDRDPRWEAYLHPSFPKIWTFRGDVPKYEKVM